MWGQTNAGLYPFLSDFPSRFSLVFGFVLLLMCCVSRENGPGGDWQRTRVVHGCPGAAALCLSYSTSHPSLAVSAFPEAALIIKIEEAPPYVEER